MTKTKIAQIKMVRAARTSPAAQTSLTSILITLLLILLLPVFATAQLPVPPSSQLILRVSSSRRLWRAGLAAVAVQARTRAGFITVDGDLITVPSETIVILPANALTWQELFAFAPVRYAGAATGMALNDVRAPLTTYEAHMIGNRVPGGPGGADVYIAGLIYISQQALNRARDTSIAQLLTTGEMRVGGPIGNCAAGARVKSTTAITTAGDVAFGTGRYAADKRRIRGSR